VLKKVTAERCDIVKVQGHRLATKQQGHPKSGAEISAARGKQQKKCENGKGLGNHGPNI